MDPDRTKRLQAILQWSLHQQEQEGERIQGPRGAQIDPEVWKINDWSLFKFYTIKDLVVLFNESSPDNV